MEREQQIKNAWIEIFGLGIYRQIEKAIDSDGWYSNERNDQWLPIQPPITFQMDFRNDNTEVRPTSLSQLTNQTP